MESGLRIAGGPGPVEQGQLAAEEIEDAGVGLGRLEQPPDGVAGAGGAVEGAWRLARRWAWASSVCAPVTVSSSPRPSWSSRFSLKKGSSRPPKRLRARRTPLAIAPSAAPVRGVEVQDAIGLAVADRAQHDGFGLQGPGIEGASLGGLDRVLGPWAAHLASRTAPLMLPDLPSYTF